MLSGKKLLYLMEIHRLQQDLPGKIKLLDIGKALNVKKPTVHSMVCDLTSLGLVQVHEENGLCLTEEGEALAVRYREYRRKLTGFLVDSMYLTAEEAGLCAVELLSLLPEERLQHFFAMSK